MTEPHANPTTAAAFTASAVAVRPAHETDLPRLTEIYNHYVINTPITFDLDPVTVDQRRAWLAHFDDHGPHRLLVAEEAGLVIGYAGSHQFRDRKAYDTTVETTIYCAHDHTGRGIGRILYAALFQLLSGQDLRVAIAGITLPNDASVALHARFGFTPVGVMHHVGRKFEQYWDVGFYEKQLEG